MEPSEQKPESSATPETSPTTPIDGATTATPNAATPISTEETALSNDLPWYKQSALLGALGIALLLLLGAAGWYGYKTYLEPVATINDTKISKKEFNDNVALISRAAEKQQADLSDPTVQSGIREQALNILIEDALFRDAGKRANITSTQEEVDIEYTNLLNSVGGAEKLAALIVEAGITDEKLRENIQKRVIANKYIAQETDIENVTASPEEVEAFLASVVAAGNELPPKEALESMRPQIEAQIVEQEKQQMITSLMEKMKGDAKIMINIDI